MNLEDIRREYLQSGLDREDLNDNPFQQFQSWLDMAIQAELSADPTAMTLATVNAAGVPRQRTVLLKHLDDEGLVFYTNLGSRKAQDITENSNVSLHFAWLPLERQVSISGQATKLSIAEATRYFLSRPHESQLAAWASRQSSRVSSRLLIEQAFDQMKKKFRKGDVPLPSFWGGYRIRPQRFEFWQGRASRLHDRFEYLWDGSQWDIGRLQP